eukprot:4277999-Pleurochrysis_carterae.AAC.1
MSQKQAFLEGRAYKLRAWTSLEGRAFFHHHVEPLLTRLWSILRVEYPDESLEMHAPEADYRLVGTGFTKVTVALNNPALMHTDRGNFGVTDLVSFDVSGEGLVLRGGSHAFLGSGMANAFVVQDRAEGVVCVGHCSRIMHCNMATVCGRRFIVAAYCVDMRS